MDNEFYDSLARSTGSNDAEKEKNILNNSFSELSSRTGQSSGEVLKNLKLNNIWNDDIHPSMGMGCGSSVVMEQLIQDNPEMENILLQQKAVITKKFFEIREEEVEREVAKVNLWTVAGPHVPGYTEPPWSPAHGNDDVLKICCVIHVCVPGIESNPNLVPDSVLQSGMEQLNAHFKGYKESGHPDYDPAKFPDGARWADRYAGDTKIEFYWVPGDPNTRINKNYASGTAISFLNTQNYNDPANGGSTPADVSKYCNIYIVDGDSSSGGPAGFASGPSVGNNKDGITINWSAWYSNPNRYNAAGQHTMPNEITLVHEAGHYLGLAHTWGQEKAGDDNAQCESIDDWGIKDTPAQNGPNEAGVCQANWSWTEFANGNMPGLCFNSRNATISNGSGGLNFSSCNLTREQGAIKTINNIQSATGWVVGTYNNVSATGGSGSDVKFNVAVSTSNPPYAITITTNSPTVAWRGGKNYTVGDTLTIAGNDVGGGPDIVFDVDSVGPGAITPPASCTPETDSSGMCLNPTTHYEVSNYFDYGNCACKVTSWKFEMYGTTKKRLVESTDCCTRAVSHWNRNSCVSSPDDFNDMWENYMDYSSCAMMFTKGQKWWMRAVILTYRKGLLCAEAGTTTTSAGATTTSGPCFVCENGEVVYRLEKPGTILGGTDPKKDPKSGYYKECEDDKSSGSVGIYENAYIFFDEVQSKWALSHDYKLTNNGIFGYHTKSGNGDDPTGTYEDGAGNQFQVQVGHCGTTTTATPTCKPVECVDDPFTPGGTQSGNGTDGTWQFMSDNGQFPHLLGAGANVSKLWCDHSLVVTGECNDCTKAQKGRTAGHSTWYQNKCYYVSDASTLNQSSNRELPPDTAGIGWTEVDCCTTTTSTAPPPVPCVGDTEGSDGKKDMILVIFAHDWWGESLADDLQVNLNGTPIGKVPWANKKPRVYRNQANRGKNGAIFIGSTDTSLGFDQTLKGGITANGPSGFCSNAPCQRYEYIYLSGRLADQTVYYFDPDILKSGKNFLTAKNVTNKYGALRYMEVYLYEKDSTTGLLKENCYVTSLKVDIWADDDWPKDWREDCNNMTVAGPIKKTQGNVNTQQTGVSTSVTTLIGKSTARKNEDCGAWLENNFIFKNLYNPVNPGKNNGISPCGGCPIVYEVEVNGFMSSGSPAQNGDKFSLKFFPWGSRGTTTTPAGSTATTQCPPKECAGMNCDPKLDPMCVDRTGQDFIVTAEYLGDDDKSASNLADLIEKAAPDDYPLCTSVKGNVVTIVGPYDGYGFDLEISYWPTNSGWVQASPPAGGVKPPGHDSRSTNLMVGQPFVGNKYAWTYKSTVTKHVPGQYTPNGKPVVAPYKQGGSGGWPARAPQFGHRWGPGSCPDNGNWVTQTINNEESIKNAECSNSGSSCELTFGPNSTVRWHPRGQAMSGIFYIGQYMTQYNSECEKTEIWECCATTTSTTTTTTGTTTPPTTPPTTLCYECRGCAPYSNKKWYTSLTIDPWASIANMQTALAACATQLITDGLPAAIYGTQACSVHKINQDPKYNGTLAGPCPTVTTVAPPVTTTTQTTVPPTPCNPSLECCSWVNCAHVCDNSKKGVGCLSQISKAGMNAILWISGGNVMNDIDHGMVLTVNEGKNNEESVTVIDVQLDHIKVISTIFDHEIGECLNIRGMHFRTQGDWKEGQICHDDSDGWNRNHSLSNFGNTPKPHFNPTPNDGSGTLNFEPCSFDGVDTVDCHGTIYTSNGLCLDTSRMIGDYNSWDTRINMDDLPYIKGIGENCGPEANDTWTCPTTTVAPTTAPPTTSTTPQGQHCYECFLDDTPGDPNSGGWSGWYFWGPANLQTSDPQGCDECKNLYLQNTGKPWVLPYTCGNNTIAFQPRDASLCLNQATTPPPQDYCVQCTNSCQEGWYIKLTYNPLDKPRQAIIACREAWKRHSRQQQHDACMCDGSAANPAWGMRAIEDENEISSRSQVVSVGGCTCAIGSDWVMGQAYGNEPASSAWFPDSNNPNLVHTLIVEPANCACTPGTTPPPIGPCCFHAVGRFGPDCRLMTQAQCLSWGASPGILVVDWKGAGKKCEHVDCTNRGRPTEKGLCCKPVLPPTTNGRGACCVEDVDGNAECHDNLTQKECLDDKAGVQWTQGAVCSANPCNRCPSCDNAQQNGWESEEKCKEFYCGDGVNGCCGGGTNENENESENPFRVHLINGFGGENLRTERWPSCELCDQEYPNDLFLNKEECKASVCISGLALPCCEPVTTAAPPVGVQGDGLSDCVVLTKQECEERYGVGNKWIAGITNVNKAACETLCGDNVPEHCIECFAASPTTNMVSWKITTKFTLQNWNNSDPNWNLAIQECNKATPANVTVTGGAVSVKDCGDPPAGGDAECCIQCAKKEDWWDNAGIKHEYKVWHISSKIVPAGGVVMDSATPPNCTVGNIDLIKEACAAAWPSPPSSKYPWGGGVVGGPLTFPNVPWQGNVGGAQASTGFGFVPDWRCDIIALPLPVATTPAPRPKKCIQVIGVKDSNARPDASKYNGVYYSNDVNGTHSIYYHLDNCPEASLGQNNTTECMWVVEHTVFGWMGADNSNLYVWARDYDSGLMPEPVGVNFVNEDGSPIVVEWCPSCEPLVEMEVAVQQIASSEPCQVCTEVGMSTLPNWQVAGYSTLQECKDDYCDPVSNNLPASLQETSCCAGGTTTSTTPAPGTTTTAPVGMCCFLAGSSQTLGCGMMTEAQCNDMNSHNDTTVLSWIAGENNCVGFVDKCNAATTTTAAGTTTTTASGTTTTASGTTTTASGTTTTTTTAAPNNICLTASNAVTFSTVNGVNSYIFGGSYGSYKTTTGTYVLTGVPSAHPIAILNNGKTSQISYTGTTSQGTKTALDGNSYQYFYGDITITVSSNYGTVSYECWNHGYMGGQNNLSYDASCTQPTTTTSAPPSTTTTEDPGGGGDPNYQVRVYDGSCVAGSIEIWDDANAIGPHSVGDFVSSTSSGYWVCAEILSTSSLSGTSTITMGGFSDCADCRAYDEGF